MKLETAIQKAKTKLTVKASVKGLYENFGQDEVRKLEDKYIDISNYSLTMNRNRQMIMDFNNWCCEYTLRP